MWNRWMRKDWQPLVCSTMRRYASRQMYLIILLCFASAKSKPVAEEDVRNQEDSIYDDFDYDWTIETSGYSSYAEHGIGQTNCPDYCTCVVDTMISCSRQGIVSIGHREEIVWNTASKILNESIPRSATVLHLGYNNLTYLPPGIFADAEDNGPCNIKDFYIQNNQIKAIHPDAFVSLTNLKVLDLSNNFLTSLIQDCSHFDNSLFNDEVLSDFQCDGNVSEANFLHSAPETLVSLNLNNNQIKGLPNYSFLALPDLEVLRLSWNQITWISRKAFYGLHKLKTLQLRGNHFDPNTASKLADILQHFITGEIFTTPDESTIPGMSSLKVIPNVYHINSAASRRRRRHRNQAVVNVPQSTYETIELDSLCELDLGDTNIDQFPSTFPPSLRRLYLDLNRIFNIPTKVLRNGRNLEFLHLGGNGIVNLRDHNFDGLDRLRVLDLSRNKLESLTVNTFTGLTALMSLRLYGNPHLSYLPRKVFWPLPYLKLLYLHDCNLRDIPSGPWIFRIIALWLYGNPIKCSCDNLISLLTRILKPLNYPLRLDPYRSVLWDDSDTWEYQRPVKTMCDTPIYVKDYQLTEISGAYLTCTYEDLYENELSRRIASSRVITSDYQQDSSTTAQSTGDEPLEVHKRDSKDISKLDETIPDYEKFELRETGVDGLAPEIELELDESGIPSFPVHFDESNDVMGKTILEDNRFPNHTQILEPLLPNVTYIKDTSLPSTKEEKLSTNTEWVISLSVPVGVERSPKEELRKAPKSDASENAIQPTQVVGAERHGDILKTTRVPTAVVRENSKDDHLETDLNGVADTGDQGYADYLFYDDGDVDTVTETESQFAMKLENMLSDNEKLKLKQEIDLMNDWKIYQDYYRDDEASADDYDQILEEYKFATQLRNLADTASSFEDLLGNLSQMYNISLDGDEAYEE